MSTFTTAMTTVKGPKRETELYPCTAFVGPNMSGKSAWLEAIWLALTGEHVKAGRSAAQLRKFAYLGQDLLADISGPEASATYVLSGAGRATPSQTFGGLLEHMSSEERRAICLRPCTLEFLSFGSKKAKEALASRFSGGVDVQLTTFSAPQQRVWDEAMARLGDTDSALYYGALGTIFRSMALEVGKQIGAQEKQIAELKSELRQAGVKAGPQFLGTTKQLDQLRADYERALAQEHEVVSYEAYAAQFTQAAAEATAQATQADYASHVAAAEARAQDAAAEVQRASKEESQTAERCAAEADRLIADLEVLRAKLLHVQQNGGLQQRVTFASTLFDISQAYIKAGHTTAACPFCGAADVDISARVEPLRTRKATREQQVREALPQIADLQAAIDDKSRALNQVYVPRDRAHAQTEQARAIEQETQRQLSTLRANKPAATAPVLPQLPAAPVPPKISSAELRAQICAVEESTLMQKRAQMLASELDDLKQRKLAIKACQDEAKELLDMLLGSIKSECEAAVNAAMPEGFSISLDLDKMDWLMKSPDGHFRGRTLQTGVQSAILQTAVTLALAPETSSGLRYLFVDDEDLLGFDDVHLTAFFELLAQLVQSGQLTQVFAATSRSACAQAMTTIDVTKIAPCT